MRSARANNESKHNKTIMLRGNEWIHSWDMCNYDLHYVYTNRKANGWEWLMMSDGMFIKLFNTNTIFIHGKFSNRNRKYIELAHTSHSRLHTMSRDENGMSNKMGYSEAENK